MNFEQPQKEQPQKIDLRDHSEQGLRKREEVLMGKPRKEKREEAKEEEKLTPEEIIALGAKNEPGSVELELLRRAADERERKEKEGK